MARDPAEGEVEERADAKAEMRAETESFTAGPGVVATKSQARGSLAGILLGGLVGALLAVGIGLLVVEGSGTNVVIAAVVGAVAGMTFGGVVGGFTKPRHKLEGTEADK